MDFGHRDIHADNLVAIGCVRHLIHDIDFERNVNVVKFGLNYRARGRSGRHRY
jgi:hypothetical protein